MLGSARTWIAAGWLAAAACMAGCQAAPKRAASAPGDGPAKIVPRADDLGLTLSIDMLDGTPVNIPEATRRELPPGRHEIGVKLVYKPLSPGAVMFGLGTISAIASAAQKPVKQRVVITFDAEPGGRYLVNGAREDGAIRIWIEDERTQAVVGRAN